MGMIFIQFAIHNYNSTRGLKNMEEHIIQNGRWYMSLVHDMYMSCMIIVIIDYIGFQHMFSTKEKTALSCLNPKPLFGPLMKWDFSCNTFVLQCAIIHPLLFFKNRHGYFFGFAYQGKDIVFRFIIEYSSLRDFGP
jgi:hypothetical protein